MSDFDDPSTPESGESSGHQPVPPALPQLGLPSLGDSIQEPRTLDATGLPPLTSPPDKKSKRVSRFRSFRIAIIALFLLLAAVGWVVRTVREARATPNDKQACTSVLGVIELPIEQTMSSMMTDLGKADDNTLRATRTNIVADLSSKNIPSFAADLNKAIGRCRDISGEFRNKFSKYCETHANSCTHSTKLNPF